MNNKFPILEVISGVKLNDQEYKIMFRYLISKYRYEISDVLDWESKMSLTDQLDQLDDNDYSWNGDEYEFIRALNTEMSNSPPIWDHTNMKGVMKM